LTQKDGKIVLALPAKQKPLLDADYVKRLEKSLSGLYNQPIQVTVELTNNTVDSPRQLKEKAQAAKLDAAHQSIKEDTNVKRLMEAFDATVVEKSIVSHSEEDD